MTGLYESVTESDYTIHIGESGLWIPHEMREFEGQIVFRTPTGTIQHFESNGGELEPYYGLIQADDFCEETSMDPSELQNPDLAPNKVSIKKQGEEAVIYEVDTDPDVKCDGGNVTSEQTQQSQISLSAADLTTLTEGNEVIVSARKTPMTVVSVSNRDNGRIDVTLENHHGKYVLLGHSNGTISLHNGDAVIDRTVDVFTTNGEPNS